MTRARVTSLGSALVVAWIASNPVFAGEDKTVAADDSPFFPTVAFGFSYPLIVSGSVGALLPLGKQDKSDVFPTSPALRIDGEIGLGGGSAAAGVYVPARDGSFAVNLKAARMRTWLLTWGVETNRTFDGGVAEFVLLGHVPGKVGVGFFRDTEPLNNKRESFTYVFFGVGW